MSMTQAEFAEKLAAQGDDTRFSGGVTKYQHVERMGSENVEGLLDVAPDESIVVQEKIDGANLSVWMDGDRLCIASRNRELSGDDDGEFRGAVGYVRGHEGIRQVLTENPDWILRGEFLVKHTVVYSPGAWNKFYVFDVQTKDGAYVPLWGYHELLWVHDVSLVPYIAEFHGIAPTLVELQEMAAQPSDLGAPKREGVVVKRYGFVNKFGRTQWGKVVNEEFAEVHKLEQCTEKDPVEVRFVARCVTNDLIRKTIGKIEDNHGRRFETRDIPELLGRVWYDAFQEELRGFVKKEKVGLFDFRAANQLAVRKTRDFALAYCGGSL